MSIAPTSPLLVPALRTRHALIQRARNLRRLADQLEAEASIFDDGARTGQRWMRIFLGHRGSVGSPDLMSVDDLLSLAVARAFEGQPDEARRLAAKAEAASRGQRDAIVGANFARAIAWAGEGKCDEAFDVLASQLSLPGDPLLVESIAGVVGLLGELALRTHRTEEARRHLGPWNRYFDSMPLSDLPELALGQLLLSKAPLVDTLARELAGGADWSTFALARIHLLLGMELRRNRRPKESRMHLTIAVDLMAELGAGPWECVARNELRASGVRSSDSSTWLALSTQESAVVQLAARGFSNREIGERLYLSPRTVSSHLYRVFPKLGITSRHQLADRLRHETAGRMADSAL